MSSPLSYLRLSMAEIRKGNKTTAVKKIKLTLKLFLSRFRIKFRRLIRRCPRWLRVLAGPLLGALIGLAGGIPGVLIGLLMGYLVGKLFVQTVQNRRIIRYFENPGPQEFYEGESGLAAWCALSVLIVSKNTAESQTDLSSEKILRRVILQTSYVFTGPLADPSLIEQFSRLALANQDSLNPDILAESLAARRASSGDLKDLGRILSGLAEGQNARALAGEIRLILDPAWQAEREYGNSGTDVQTDPWKILGLPPGTPLTEVKAHYRRLAKQFHPDEVEVLDENHRQAAAQAFIAIKEAYRQITS